MCPGLINALLGEMERSSGRVAIGGRMAYVAQQAWILNESLKENILFGHPFDEARWDSVIKVPPLHASAVVSPPHIMALYSSEHVCAPRIAPQDVLFSGEVCVCNESCQSC